MAGPLYSSTPLCWGLSTCRVRMVAQPRHRGPLWVSAEGTTAPRQDRCPTGAWRIRAATQGASWGPHREGIGIVASCGGP
eukprot:9486583-Pyramimonas_sp.AAC.1